MSPVLEDQILAESGIGIPQCEEGDEPGAGFVVDHRTGNPKAGATRVVGSKKRKGETGEETQGTGEQPDRPKRKRRKGPDGEPVVDVEQAVEGEESGEESGKSNQRFILFLGNLKYTTTAETIRGHFSACDPPPTVRLLTPKLSTSKPPTKLITKSKGCAFLEFENKHALQRALKLHHSELEGRKINVELTAGGGGKGEARLKKLKDRNKGLDGQRVCVLRLSSLDSNLTMYRSVKNKGGRLAPISRQVIKLKAHSAFSATSGAEQVQVKKRTWSVGDVVETEKHRGGKKHAKDGQGRKAKSFGTGVNAIRVG
ncbi:hypothetical protein F5J12DRAFT_768170 [Pisolithus orientalis]|uniref:uncharacterized protein n=1 Tax=Pisolithus orientalis TaxID=936130 RepID=UPI0022242A6E|nr:uncharacterized protein F5J12DRAFT_768170 [Pisolithus orientalis]KAI6008366.1 hypothetical protein F5J12DRAFT_768170 [Pisolithus orientalis]